MKLNERISHIPPLSPADEDDLIASAQKGDRDAACRIATAYLNLAWRIATEILEPLEGDEDRDVSDVIGEATLGVYEALERFDPSRNRPFAAYVEPWIRGRIFGWLRCCDGTRSVSRVRLPDGTREYQTPDETSLDAPLDLDDGTEGTLHDVLSGDQRDRALEDAAVNLAARNALDSLPPSERATVQAHLLYDLTFDEIAKQRGVSRQAVQQSMARGLQRLRIRLGRATDVASLLRAA